MPDGTSTDRPLTLADILTELEHKEGLAPTRRRDLVSAVRRTAEMLGQQPASVPASVSALRPRLEAIEPAAHGLSTKTWSNVRSNLLSALRASGATKVIRTDRIRLNPEWRRFHEGLPDKRYRTGLSRFVRFCNSTGVSPAAVDDTVLDQFNVFVREGTLAKKPDRIHRDTARLWNEVSELSGDQRLTRLTIPSYRKPKQSLALSDFPDSFQSDVKQFLAWRADPDPFDDDAPAKPLAPTTLRTIRSQILLGASALVDSGCPLDSVQGLADLVTVDAVKTILRSYHERNNGRANTWTDGLAQCLTSIAKLWVKAPSDQILALKRLRSKLPKVETGLRLKNREALRQFDDPTNLARLLQLPEDLFEEACKSKAPSERDAVKAQLALAIEILLQIPIRSGNLIALRADQHIVRPAGPKGKAFLSITAAEVKNDGSIDYELPPSLAKMLDLYMTRFQPVLAREPSPYIFVASGGRRKSRGTLAQQVQETIRKRTGLSVTLHQFRHLAAKLLLDAHPENYEAARQLLSHKNLKTTIGSYAGLNTLRAGKVHDELIQRLRDELPKKPIRRRRTRR